MSERSRRVMRIAAVILILLGAWRLLSLVAHEPIYGYGNQFDMSRTSACLDLWPAAAANASENELQEMTPAAPLTRYQIRAVDKFPCYYSTEAAWDRAVLFVRALVSDATTVDLRLIGMSKALALLVSAGFCGFLLWRFPFAGLLHALIFGAVLCDPMVTLYANSLYTEFSAVWGGYLFVTSFAAYALRLGKQKLTASAIGAVLGLGLLSCSRVPNAAIAFALCAVALMYLWRWRAGGRLALGLVLSTLAGVLVALSNQSGSESIQRANAANTVYFTFLAASHAPSQFMQRLGMPESCQRYGFSSWYLGRGVPMSDACAEVMSFSRLALVSATLHEPMLGVRVVANAFAQSRGWRMRYVGEVGGGNYSVAKQASLADYAPKLPYFVYVFGLFLTLLLALGLWLMPRLVLTAQQQEQGHWRCVQSLSGMLCLLLLLPLLISLIGDGYTELPRHAHLSTVVVVPILVIGMAGFAAMLRESGHLKSLALGLASVIVLALLGAYALVRQPAAIGVWKHDLWGGHTHKISGSVLDPYGIDTAFARAANYADQLLMVNAPGKDMRWVFQGYPESNLILGEIQLHAPYTEIVVRNRLGVETVVDRIWPAK